MTINTPMEFGERSFDLLIRLLRNEINSPALESDSAQRDFNRNFYSNDGLSFKALVQYLITKYEPQIDMLYIFMQNQFGVNARKFEVSHPHYLCGVLFRPLTEELRALRRNLRHALEEVSGRKGVIIVGAGLSYESDLNRNTLKGILRTVFVRLNITSSKEVEQLFERDSSGTLLFSLLVDRGGNEGVELFQEYFRDEVAKRRFELTDGHKQIARIAYMNKIEHLINLNWDNFIELSYESLFDRPITDSLEIIHKGQHRTQQRPCLWKPNGCVTRRERWTLPGESSSMPDDLQKALSQLSSVFCFSIGFRGDDVYNESSFRKLLAGHEPIFDVRPYETVPLEEKWQHSIRIPTSATWFLNQLVSRRGRPKRRGSSR